MAGRSRTLSEQGWAKQPPHVLRCVARYKSTGERCRRVAEDGSVVCDQHGGAAPQVIRRAAERVQFTADDAARRLVEWMNDEKVDMRERVKIAQDMLDRGGLAAQHLLKVMPVVEDRVEKLFKDILGSENPLMDPEPEHPALPSAAPPVLDEFSSGKQTDSLRADENGSSHRPQAVNGELKPTPVTTPKHIREALKSLL